MTPIRLLTAAIHSNDPTGIKTLLNQHPELLSYTGQPCYAAYSGYLEALKALLDCGFTIHDRKQGSECTFKLANRKVQSDPLCHKIASRHGRRTNEREFVMTPIRLLTAAIHSNDPTGIKTLLNQHPELLSYTGQPCYAAYSGYLEALEALLDCGFTIHDRDKLSPGISLLRRAAMGGDIRTVEYLIERGCDGKEPGILNGAVRNSVELMQLLILAGADPYSTSGNPPRNAFEQAQMSSTEATRAFLETLRDETNQRSTLVERLQNKLAGELVKLDRYVLAGAPFWMARCKHGDTNSAVTVGLSDTSWTCEFRVVLPANWPDTQELGADVYWPVDYLLDVLRSLHGQSGLPSWQTVANGEPAMPITIGSSAVGGVFVSETDDREAPRVTTLVFLTAAELELARRSTEKFAEVMGAAGLNPFQATLLHRESAI